MKNLSEILDLTPYEGGADEWYPLKGKLKPRKKSNSRAGAWASGRMLSRRKKVSLPKLSWDKK